MKKGLLAVAAAGGVVFSLSNGQAAAQTAPEPEPVEYVRVCDAYGEGYFYIPGTDTCMRIGGFVFAQAVGGHNVYARSLAGLKSNKWRVRTRAQPYFDIRKETELGLLRTHIELRSEYHDGRDVQDGNLRFGYIDLSGLRIGLDESALNTFFDYYGNFINDDVHLAGAYRTNMIQYTHGFENGISFVASIEQGSNDDTDFNGETKTYAPHAVVGVKYEQGWGSLTAAAAYDAVNFAWVGKAKVSLNVTDKMNVWLMAAYKDMGDEYYLNLDDRSTRIRDRTKGIRAMNSFYGTWGGHWVSWLGGSYQFTPKTASNLQLSYEGVGNIYTTFNVVHEMVPGLIIIPEVSYQKWKDLHSELYNEDAFSGALRLRRNF